ncbi:MAG: hypothetical protein DI603_08535 [Roseateles depolymerans]|uniref:Solute-binding protein family 3/N-terminal domain-containing protein n=1 Tax=Roseateles depolymerans TaxID=76731 RepID=A0A2W5DW50_9BURK|nr:MAG: hypothetical protein DI603_08535 [Roseateles depolymerans]
MRKSWSALAALALLCVGAAAVAAGEAGTIRWVVQDIPPHFHLAQGRVPRGPEDLRGDGEVEGFMRVLLARMPEYRHEFVEAGASRYEALSRGGATLCSTLLLRSPERLDWLYFSHLYPPLASRQLNVVVRRDMLARIQRRRDDDNGALDLAALLDRMDLHGLIARDRAYGPHIDAVLNQHPLPRLAVGGSAVRLLDMLRAGRMDYTLEYPSVVEDYLKRLGRPGELVSLPLREGTSTPLAMVSCSRNPEGRRDIEAIDAAVRRLAAEPRREDWYRRWRGGRFDAHDFERLNAYMDERARGGARIE